MLLCLVGPTYIERIWCIIELYTFLKMGGSTNERLLVMPIGSTHATSDEDEVEEVLFERAIDQCRRFDVTATKCFDEAQRQALLSVIELGFGSLETFNSLIRSIVPGKLEERLIAKSSSQQAMLVHGASAKPSNKQHGIGKQRSSGALPSKSAVRTLLPPSNDSMSC